MQQGNVGSVKKKDVEGELGRISAQMPVVHVVQRNVKARIADTPLILLNFLRAQSAEKSMWFCLSLSEVLWKVV